MKRLLAASVLAGLSLTVHAQSTVTLFGIIDEGVDFTNNVRGGKVFALTSGYYQSSRWGLRGEEDLGGGFKTVFQLENGFNGSNGKLGQGGLMFGRQAYVGVSNLAYGSIKLGRQYDSIVDYMQPLSTFVLATHPYDNDNVGNTSRENNSIKYTSPNLMGLQFGGTYSFSNDSNFANNRAYSAGARYSTGGLSAAVAFLQANNPSATAAGAITNAGDQNFVSTLMRVFGAGASYNFGSATLGFMYTNSYMQNPTSSIYVGSIKPGGTALSNARFQNFELNGKYYFTPAFYLSAEYVYTRATLSQNSGKLHPNYQSVGLLGDYLLSKRTDIYVMGSYQHVGGDTTGSVLDTAYLIGASGPSSNKNQLFAHVGIRHKF